MGLFEIVIALVVVMAMVLVVAVTAPLFVALTIPLNTAMADVGGSATLAVGLMSLWPLLIGAVLLVGLLFAGMNRAPVMSAGMGYSERRF